MDAQTVLVKTAQGAEALSHRDHELPRVLRHALILVDGQSTVAELEVKGAIIPDFLAQLRELLVRGLVVVRGKNSAATPVPSPGGPPTGALVASLVGLAQRVLGDKAGKVVKKIEESGATPGELGACIDACFKLIRLTIDESKAEEFRRAAKELIGRG